MAEHYPVPPQLRVFVLSELGEAGATDSIRSEDDRADGTTYWAVRDGRRRPHHRSTLAFTSDAPLACEWRHGQQN